MVAAPPVESWKVGDWEVKSTTGPVLALPAPSGEPREEVHGLLARLRAVGDEGAGNAAARKAWQEVVRRGPAVLPARGGTGDCDHSQSNGRVDWSRPARVS